VLHEEDSSPDSEGLHEALRRLIEVKGQPGDPHVDPDSVLDLPRALPETVVFIDR
jgi:hypothetical protein